jgi:hypothetical protein
MAGRLAQVIDRWHQRRAEARWARAARDAAALDPATLRGLRAEARKARQRLDRLIHAADSRLALPPLGAGLPVLALGTDWAWRADICRAPLPRPGAIAATDRTAISDDCTLYHDCPLGEVALRQVRNRTEADRAPFGLSVEVFGFQGSFLSLATELPEGAIQGLTTRHVIRVDLVLDADRPLRAFARLNIRHGPNHAQLVCDLAPEGRDKLAEFDLAFARLDDTRIERAWLDLIFNDAAMTGLMLRDLTVSRRPRSEL